MILAIPTLEPERLILRGGAEGRVAPMIALRADANLKRFVGGVVDVLAAVRRMAVYAGSFLIKGYATEAARRVRAYAYDPLKFPQIASCIDLENTAFIAVARRLGATHHRSVDFRGRALGVFRHVDPAARSIQPKP